jgi:hypothetical protein
MASFGKTTAFRRQLDHKKQGARRKAHARNHGTTPVFPIHTPDADANAPAEQVSPKCCERE